ncbi:MAG: RecX family transcriptional regulator [Flavisolibacter sp.]|nr:RecX family transcriptional regulator [Flavisolibacter sp.]
MFVQKKYLTKEQALQKLRQYCAYQERSHYEAEQKLWDLGISSDLHSEMIALLIEEDYINEERFAIAFAGGKFRMKQWGRKKILYALKEKQVSPYCIKKAMKQISQDDYEAVLNQLARRKYALLKSDQYLVRKKKTIDYLLQKGFESELAVKAVNQLQKK